VEAFDVDCTSQPPAAPVQDAVPSEVRGAPPATAPSQALVLVRTVPEHVVPAAHSSEALDEEVDEGPLVGWPASGRPVVGSVTTKSGALEAAELVSPWQPPPVTVHSLEAAVPRACGETAVSRALVELDAVPPHSVAAPSHDTDAVAFETLAGPETGVTPAASGTVAASRSLTVVSVDVVQPPPAPRAVQDEEPVLSRTPVMSPDATPEVVLDPDPVHSATAQSTCAPAVLDADSSRAGSTCPAAVAPSWEARDVGASLAFELDSIAHPPALASQLAAPLLWRVAPPWALVDEPAVAVAPRPEQVAASQATSTVASLSPAVPDPDSAAELLWAAHCPPETEQSDLALVLTRPACCAVPVLASVSVALLVTAEPVQSVAARQPTSAAATTSPERSILTEDSLSQPLPASQRAVLLPCRRVSPVAVPFAASLVATASCVSARSVLEPVLSLRHEPPAPDSHAASAPSGLAVLC
jgi:hypothetical protein